MGTITTTTNTAPFQYPGSRLVVKQIGLSRWIALVKTSTANQYAIMKSTDGGSSWSTYSTITRSNIVDVGEIFTDNQGWIFWAYRVNESSTDKVYARRVETGASNKADTGEWLVGSAANGGVAGAALTGVAVCSHYNPANGYHYVVVAIGTTRGGLQGVSLVAANIDPQGNIGEGTYRFSGTREWFDTDTIGRTGVSIDKEHNGDGYNSTSPNLWVAFGRSNLRLIKVPWSGDGWTGSPGSTLIRASTGNRDTMPGLWDGTRFLMVIPDPTAGSTDRVLLYERNKANSSTTTRQSPAHPTGVVRQATMAYDTSTKNVRVYAVGTSTAVLYFVDYIRLTDAWGTWTAVSGSPAVIGTNADNFGVKANTYQDASYGPYYATGTTPFTLTYTPQSQSYSPNTPTWESPINGAAADVAASLVLDWAFTDPDPGDTQSKFALSRQVGAGSLEYWRTSDSTWQVTEQQNTSGTTSLTLTATQWSLDGLANGATDPNHTYKVKVWDSGNNASSYSAGMVVTPSAKVNPAITAPTAAQVITTDHVTLTWTATEQTRYRVQLDVQGGAQVYDSGWITDSVTRSVVVPYTLPNATAWTVKITTANNEGLASTTVTQNFSVSFTPPATPTLVATPLPNPPDGFIRVVVTNPTPGGGQPAVASNEVWRRLTGTTSTVRVGVNVANNGTLNDFRAVSGVAYEYQVLVTGVNGTSASSAWTA